ncbi:hypothetical protein ACFE04_002358 [Oxalis oulophora]
MDQAQYWMWMKRREIFLKTNYFQMKSESSSWEEKAFAQDSATRSCIWPPRSYDCSFCKREFNSAQALGGHMNVHRRDRARLKHQHSLSSEVSHLPFTQSRVYNNNKLSHLASSSQKMEKVLCEEDSRIINLDDDHQDDADETKLSIGLSFVRPSMSYGDEALMISCKRPKTSIFMISNQSGLMKEDSLDLELRLGKL